MSSQDVLEKSSDIDDLLQDVDLFTSPLQSGQTLIRKKLIYSALNFINNPRMHLSSTHQKKAFLLKKGLTQDEIDLTFDLCITRPSNDTTLMNELDLLTSLCSNSPNTFLGKLLNMMFCFVIFGGFAYGSYTLYQTKIRPIFDKSIHKKNPSEKICEEIQVLREQILELNKNVSIVHEFVRTYCRTRDDSILSLKNELSSIKSLLVSRNQFPSVPSIPKWQLESSKKTSLVNERTNGDFSTASDSADSSKSD